MLLFLKLIYDFYKDENLKLDFRVIFCMIFLILVRGFVYCFVIGVFVKEVFRELYVIV